MADYQRIVEYLRDIRGNPLTQVTDELRRYATEYADLCRQANERLRQCSVFLQQGLRTEAIHMADESPNLLEMIAALDLPEPEQWVEFCQQYDLPVPPPLQMERATQLNDAYGVDQSLDQLLKQHRVLAMRRAPIRKRLMLMRQIASQDPGGGWDKDIRTFEKARIREMNFEIGVAVGGSDPAAVAALADELDAQWLEEVPADLTTAVTGAFNKMLRSEVEAKLESKLAQIRSAFAAKSHGECAELLKQIRQMLEAADQSTVSPRIATELQPIIVWVKAEDDAAARRKAFVAGCNALTSALDAGVSPRELEPVYAKLATFDDPIPPTLEDRYRQHVANSSRREQRSFRLKLAIIGGAAAVVVAFVVFMFQLKTADDWASQIMALTSQQKLVEAERMVADQERQAPSLSAKPVLARAREETRKLRAQFEKDKVALAALLPTLTRMRDEARRTLDGGGPEQLIAAANAVSAGLRNAGSAQSLAWVDENNSLGGLLSDLRALNDDLRARAARALRDEVNKLDQQVAGITPQTDASEAADILDHAAGRLRELGRSDAADDSVRAGITALVERIDTARKGFTQAQQLASALKAVKSSADSPDSLRAAMEQYITQFPDAPLSKSFLAAIERMELDKSLDAWRELARKWDGPVKITSPNAALEAAETIAGFVATYPMSPVTAPATAYESYLRKAAETLAANGPWQTAMEALISNPLLSELHYMEDSNGRRYYVLGDIKRQDKGINERMSSFFEAIDPTDLTKRKQIAIIPPVKLATQRPVIAPHAKLAADLNDKLKTMDESNWDTWGIEAIETVRSADDVDIAVKAILLLQLLKTTEQVSGWGIGNAYEKSIQDLTRQNPDTLVWYDPDKPLTEGTKAALNKVLGAIPKSADIIDKLQATRKDTWASLGFQWIGRGVLLRDGDQPAVYSGSQILDSFVAWAIAPAGAGSSLVKIGQAKDGRIEVDPAAARDLPDGTIVYLKAE